MKPSPKAKQEAAKWWLDSDHVEQARALQAFAEGYDTATAKLCEEVQYWKERAETERDARQEVHEGQRYWENEAIRLREELVQAKAGKPVQEAEQQRDDLLAALREVAGKLGEHEGKGDKRASELIIDAFYTASNAIAAADGPATSPVTHR